MTRPGDDATIGICFHGIGRPDRELEPGEAPYWVDLDLFHGVLDLVADDPRVRISFDDSNTSDLLHGLPALRERGLGATFFVLAGRLDQRGSLGPDDVAALAAEPGMRIGTHGMDHRPWRGLDAPTARRELVEARRVLAEAAGTAVDEAALPLGRYDRRLLRDLRDLGYDRVHCSDRRWGTERAWLRPRFSVRGADTLASVARDALTPPTTTQQLKDRLRTTLKRLR